MTFLKATFIGLSIFSLSACDLDESPFDFGDDDDETTISTGDTGDAIAITKSFAITADNELAIAKLVLDTALNNTHAGLLTADVVVPLIEKPLNEQNKYSYGVQDLGDCNLDLNMSIGLSDFPEIPFSTDESINLTFSNCNHEGETYNGTMEAVFSTLTDFNLGEVNEQPHTLGLAISLTDFYLGTSSEAQKLTGDYTLENKVSELQIIQTLASESIIIASDSYTQTLKDFSFSHRFTLSTDTVKIQVSGEITQDIAAGTLAFNSTYPIEYYGDEVYPESAKLAITGTNSSMSIVIAGEQITISSDYDNDEVIDNSQDVTWQQLNAL